MMRLLRCLVVWLAATVTGALALSRLSPVPGTGDPFADLLVGLSTTALAGCVLWAWVCVTAAVVEAWRGDASRWRPAPAVLRRAVLLACGAAVLASGPAVADSRHDAALPALYAGLPFPDRAVDGGTEAVPPAARPVTAGQVIVRHGDSLWAIAARALPPGATDREVHAACRRLHRLNRAVIGDDPDLIRPGQRLRLPDPLRRHL